MDMHKMDCKNCKYGKLIKPGTYKTVTGTMIIGGSGSYKCTKDTVKNISIVGKEMQCSEYVKGDEKDA